MIKAIVRLKKALMPERSPRSATRPNNELHPALMALRRKATMIRILFLCHGNICRSPMAEFVMKDYVEKAGLRNAIDVESAALHRDELGNDIHSGTAEILERFDIAHEPRQARLATCADYERFDYLIGMDRHNMRDMRRLWHDDPLGKCSLMLDWIGLSRDVADPWYTGDFDSTYTDIDAACRALLERLKRSCGI